MSTLPIPEHGNFFELTNMLKFHTWAKKIFLKRARPGFFSWNTLHTIWLSSSWSLVDLSFKLYVREKKTKNVNFTLILGQNHKIGHISSLKRRNEKPFGNFFYHMGTFILCNLSVKYVILTGNVVSDFLCHLLLRFLKFIHNKQAVNHLMNKTLAYSFKGKNYYD